MVRSITTMMNELLARLDFWWAKRTIKEGRDFGYNTEYWRDSFGHVSRSSCAIGTLVIEVLKRPYDGVIVELSEFTVGEENGNGRIDFTTRVLYNRTEVDVSTKAFNKLITNIVRIVLIDSIEQVNAKELYNEDRDDDIVELDEERPVSTEVSAVPEKRVSKRKPRKKTVSRDSSVLPKVQQPTKRKRPKTPAGRKKRPD